jgi:3-hydroxymyristoyl/3-hydroxydecanoyl-(acyl carrier protein) dehydratase
MLAKILSASFRQWVRPGDQLLIHADVVANEERYATAECRVDVEGRTAANARLFFSFLPISSLAVEFRDDLLEDFMRERGP